MKSELDRITDASIPSVIAAYENRIATLKRDKLALGPQHLFPVSAHGTDSGLSFKECFGLVV